jgi:hypothetical protein
MGIMRHRHRLPLRLFITTVPHITADIIIGPAIMGIPAGIMGTVATKFQAVLGCSAF